MTGKSKTRLFNFWREQNFKPDRPRRTSTKIAISLFPDGFSNCLVYQTKAYEILFFNGFLFFQSYRFPHICTGSKLSNASAIFIHQTLPPKPICFLLDLSVLFNGTAHHRQHTTTMAAAGCPTLGAETFDNQPTYYATS